MTAQKDWNKAQTMVNACVRCRLKPFFMDTIKSRML